MPVSFHAAPVTVVIDDQTSVRLKRCIADHPGLAARLVEHCQHDDLRSVLLDMVIASFERLAAYERNVAQGDADELPDADAIELTNAYVAARVGVPDAWSDPVIEQVAVQKISEPDDIGSLDAWRRIDLIERASVRITPLTSTTIRAMEDDDPSKRAFSNTRVADYVVIA